jgi:adenine-specific DNA-methyltransferase
VIKYLGSKRQLIPEILKAVHDAAPKARSVVDLFSGTSRVGYALKKAGYAVQANDHNTYAYMLAKCYVETNLEDVEKQAALLIEEFNQTRGEPGYFTENFCQRSLFFHPKNGEKIDAIRERIAQKNLPPALHAVLLVSLMEAADRVDSTCGIQMAYLKKWAPRAENELKLRMPALLPKARLGEGQAHRLEAIDAAKALEADVVYLDPPYNQHSYRGNYHIWETLMLWDKPELYGRAAKRVDCKTVKSKFNSKTQFMKAFTDVVSALSSKVIVISFNNEGFITRADMETFLRQMGKVTTRTIDYKRYVGAQIGIYNPKGKVVGAVSHLRNEEYLYTLKVG